MVIFGHVNDIQIAKVLEMHDNCFIAIDEK